MESYDVLMVEDDKDQADLIVDTARVCGAKLDWERVDDGRKALAWLRSGKKPALVLLDLHLPGVDGVEVLREIKSDPQLRGLPVIIMSSSRDARDIEAAYGLGANCYIGKPGSFEGLCSLVRFLEAFLTLPVSTTGGPEASAESEPRQRTLN